MLYSFRMLKVNPSLARRLVLNLDSIRPKCMCQPLPCQNIARNYSNRQDMSNNSVERMRLIKRVGAGILFSTTLALALYSKRKKTQKLKDSLEDCQRLRTDPNYTSSMGAEFYRCNSCVFPGDIAKSGILKQLKSFELNRDDVIVASFPKSGTTWMQEIVYLIQTNLDFASAQKQVLETRFPYLEYPYPGLATIKKSQGPRMIKTHLPLSFLPDSANEKGTKIIYIARNPKDVVVSYYYFLRMATFLGYRGRFTEFVDKFIKGDVPYGPYFNHILDYWKHYKSIRNENNVLWVTYEEMHRDPEACIRKVADFLGKQLTDAQIRLIAAHTRFDRMSQNPSVNYSHWDDLGLRDKNESHFMRKGRVGDWRQHFDEETNRRFDAFIHEHLKESGLQFEYVPTGEEPHKSE